MADDALHLISQAKSSRHFHTPWPNQFRSKSRLIMYNVRNCVGDQSARRTRSKRKTKRSGRRKIEDVKKILIRRRAEDERLGRAARGGKEKTYKAKGSGRVPPH